MIHDLILQSTISPTFNDPIKDSDFDNLEYNHYFLYSAVLKIEI